MTLRYIVSLFERILAEKGKLQDHFIYHTSLIKSLGINAQAELGIESDLVPGEHATAVQKKNNSDSKVNESEPVSKLSEATAESCSSSRDNLVLLRCRSSTTAFTTSSGRGARFMNKGVASPYRTTW